MQWETEESAEFDQWFDKLGEDDQIQVIAAVEYRTDGSGRANALVVSDKAGQLVWHERVAARIVGTK